MKRWLMLLFLISFVSASVDVGNYDVRSNYTIFDKITGSVNLSISGESYDESIVLSDGSEVELGGFLRDNGAAFECSPKDCSMSYEASSGSKDKIILINPLNEKYIGFVLRGNNITLDSMSFKIDSDFGEEIRQPLVIRFFEGWDWGFDKFSDEFLSKHWGCFNPVNKKLGPLIGNSFYCEMVRIGNSDVLRVGADVKGVGGVLNMTVYPDSGFGASWDCSFNPASEEGCEISPEIGEIFSEGEYEVCVGSDSLTEYNIYEDESGESCGFAYDVGYGNSVKDYGIFAQGVKYADAGQMSDFEFGKDEVDAANFIISDRYGGDCSKGCVLPLEVSGVSQNFNIHDVNLVYTDNSEWRADNLVYNLDKTAAKVDFNGTLDLSLLDLIVSGKGEYFAKLSGEDIFRTNVSLLPSPFISSISPLDPPAGVPVTFYANIDFESNSSLSYRWNFGDNKSADSTIPYIIHSYDNLDNYTLTLTVSAGGNLSSKKSFEIRTVDPEFAVVAGLKNRKASLKNVKDVVNGFPVWYRNDVLNILNISRFENELARLDVESNNSFDVEDFIDVAQKLYAINIPIVVGANTFDSPFLMSELSDVNIEPIVIVSGSVSGATNDEYAKPILTWQNDNVDVLMKSKDVFVSYLNGEGKDILSAYSFKVTSRSDVESYFVINKPFDELFFNGNVGARKAGGATVIILEAGKTKNFDFYYKGRDRGSFFISPRLSSIITEGKINTDCNFNEVCEDGEDYKNCRSDCKPVGKTIFFLVMLVLFFLVVYSGLQIWYKKHYENYLFKDKSQLYNMLMYISNARARDVLDSKIRANLIERGWIGERVNYAMKKSRGKSVGMIEIIPIERVLAWIRDWKARGAIKKAMKVATRVQEQNNPNSIRK